MREIWPWLLLTSVLFVAIMLALFVLTTWSLAARSMDVVDESFIFLTLFTILSLLLNAKYTYLFGLNACLFWEVSYRINEGVLAFAQFAGLIIIFNILIFFMYLGRKKIKH